MFLSLDQITHSLENLKSVHPFYGMTFLACKRENLPIGRAIHFPIANHETALLRAPGQAFLITNRTPTSGEFKPHRYWKHTILDLHAAYRGICAYSARWIPPSVSRGTVDHYIPKSVDSALAYEWSNYRLCTEKMNKNKDNELDVMDPFKIQNGWFVINFATYFIEPENSLPDYLKTAVLDTISRLKLNDDDILIQERANTVW